MSDAATLANSAKIAWFNIYALFLCKCFIKDLGNYYLDKLKNKMYPIMEINPPPI